MDSVLEFLCFCWLVTIKRHNSSNFSVSAWGGPITTSKRLQKSFLSFFEATWLLLSQTMLSWFHFLWVCLVALIHLFLHWHFSSASAILLEAPDTENNRTLSNDILNWLLGSISLAFLEFLRILVPNPQSLSFFSQTPRFKRQIPCFYLILLRFY